MNEYSYQWAEYSCGVFYKINFRAIVFGKFEHPHSSSNTITGNFWHEKGRLERKKIRNDARNKVEQ